MGGVPDPVVVRSALKSVCCSRKRGNHTLHHTAVLRVEGFCTAVRGTSGAEMGKVPNCPCACVEKLEGEHPQGLMAHGLPGKACVVCSACWCGPRGLEAGQPCSSQLLFSIYVQTG